MGTAQGNERYFAKYGLVKNLGFQYRVPKYTVESLIMHSVRQRSKLCSILFMYYEKPN